MSIITAFKNFPLSLNRRKPKKNMGNKLIKVERKLTKTGNSYKVSIPPILIEKLQLMNGVILEEKEDSIVITKIEKVGWIC